MKATQGAPSTQHERLLSLVSNSVPALVSYLDRDCRYVFANDEYERWFAVPPLQVVGRTMLELLGEEAFTRVRPKVEQVLGGSRVEYEEFLRYRGGISRWVRACYTPDFAADGNVRGFVALVIDITDHKRAERALEESRKQAAFLAEASALFTSSLDLDSTLASVAKLSLREFADVCLIYLKEGEDRLRVAAVATDSEREQLMAGSAPRSMALSADVPSARVARNNRSEWRVSISPDWLTPTPRERCRKFTALAPRSFIVAPLSLPSGVLGSIAFGRAEPNPPYAESDVQFAEELARRAALAVDNAGAYHRAEEAIRIKDQFLCTVSHELRTPLSAILGWATILRADLGRTTENLQRGLEVIERNARSQARIIEDILDTAQIVRGQLQLRPETVEVAEIARGAIDSFRPAATAKGLTLELSGSSSCRLHADPERLRQVLWNLLGNAVKFTPVGGHIDLWIEDNGRLCTISVRDTGQGIDPCFLPHLFELFRQADGSIRRAIGGLGLGLALARHLVELHGGTIGASSPGLGQGATFVVSLPIALPQQPLVLLDSPPPSL